MVLQLHCGMKMGFSCVALREAMVSGGDDVYNEFKNRKGHTPEVFYV